MTGKRTHSCLCLYQAIRLGCSFKLFGVGGFGALARWSGIVPFSGIVADRQKGLGCVGFGGGTGDMVVLWIWISFIWDSSVLDMCKLNLLYVTVLSSDKIFVINGVLLCNIVNWSCNSGRYVVNWFCFCGKVWVVLIINSFTVLVNSVFILMFNYMLRIFVILFNGFGNIMMSFIIPFWLLVISSIKRLLILLFNK